MLRRLVWETQGSQRHRRKETQRSAWSKLAACGETAAQPHPGPDWAASASVLQA